MGGEIKISGMIRVPENDEEAMRQAVDKYGFMI